MAATVRKALRGLGSWGVQLFAACSPCLTLSRTADRAPSVLGCCSYFLFHDRERPFFPNRGGLQESSKVFFCCALSTTLLGFMEEV